MYKKKIFKKNTNFNFSFYQSVMMFYFFKFFLLKSVNAFRLSRILFQFKVNKLECYKIEKIPIKGKFKTRISKILNF